MSITAPASQDTIAAIATPPGKGGVAIVRVSGPAVPSIIAAVTGPALSPRHATLRKFLDANRSVIDQGIALYYPGPNSFSGEDMLELQAHGGPVVADLLLRRVICLGARLAQPGEFTARAYINGKLDLAQAEAVADLIDAATEQAAKSAQRSLQGEFSGRVKAIDTELIRLRTYVEATIDFVDEEIDLLSDGNVGESIDLITSDLEQLMSAAHQGALLREGLTVVIAGRPNVGKSRLLNRLAEREAAIVTDIAGTTRDVIREHIQIDGLPLHILDTAGLRETSDQVEQEGVRRARAAISQASHVLLVVDDRVPREGEELIPDLPSEIRLTRVHNKIDLTGNEPRIESDAAGDRLYLSAETGSGLDLLRRHLKECAGYQGDADGLFSARRRHVDALRRAWAAVASAKANVTSNQIELLADDLRAAHEALGDITGRFTPEDLLGSIFGSFCIGK